MAPSLRNLFVGLCAGAALSLARAPVGMELADGPAVDALRAALFRALALLTVALGVGPRVRVPALLTGAAAGFALHGLLLSERVAVVGWGTLALVLALAVVAMSQASPREPEPPESPGASGPGPTLLERLGLVVTAAGAAVALESVARVLRLYGAGQPSDDTAFGAAFLAAVALGAGAFGGWITGGRRAAAGLAGGLALTAATCLFSLDLLGQIADHGTLDRFLRRPPWSLDLSAIGRLTGDLLIGWRVLLAPAFVLGAALCGARERGRWTSVGAGAALGLVLLPLVFIAGDPVSEERAGLLAAERVGAGALIAAVGALIAVAGAWRGLPRAAALVGATAGAVALAIAFAGPRPYVLPLSPWQTFPPAAEWLADTPEGLVTVETQPDGHLVATLDRLRLTPNAAEQGADEQQLRLSFALLDEQRRASARVLLVGQLTPMRAFVLRELGAQRVDRTAAWHASMSALEVQLLGEVRTEGDVLSPAEAGERARSGRYDLIIAPSVPGTAPRPALADELGGARAVVWLAASSGVAGRRWGKAVLLSSDGFDQLAVGVHGGGEGVPAGRPDRSVTALGQLLQRSFVRDIEAERATARRLAEAAVGSPYEPLCSGLLAHLAVQVQSSPWDSPAQSTELSDEALALLGRTFESLPDARIAAFARDLWEGIAELLVEKREIDLAFEHLEPLAAARDPWPALERALARADLEVLDPESAARRMEKVIAANPYDLEARLARAHALGMAGDPAAEADELRHVLAVQPGRRDVLRRLAVALVRAGDPEGGELIEDLLLEDPDDEELRKYLGTGPFEPLPVEFMPGGGHDH